MTEIIREAWMIVKPANSMPFKAKFPTDLRLLEQIYNTSFFAEEVEDGIAIIYEFGHPDKFNCELYDREYYGTIVFCGVTEDGRIADWPKPWKEFMEKYPELFVSGGGREHGCQDHH